MFPPNPVWPKYSSEIYKNSLTRCKWYRSSSFTMAQLNSTIGDVCKPCNSCSASTKALNILAMLLHTAVQGRTSIHYEISQTDLFHSGSVHSCANSPYVHFVLTNVLLTMFTEIPLPLCRVLTEQIPQELHNVCDHLGYQMVQGMHHYTSLVFIFGSIFNFTVWQILFLLGMVKIMFLSGTVKNLVPDGPIISSSASNAGNVKSNMSMSTDWEGEFSIEPSPGSVPSSITLACMYIIASSPSCLRLICWMVGMDSLSHEEEHWYSVIIGRNPSIYNGSWEPPHCLHAHIHIFVRFNITANVSGVPGGFAWCYATQDLA